MTRTFMPSALTLAMLAATSAHAADAQANATQQLPEIVVTASKTPENINLVPASISVIDSKTIQQSTVQSLGQLLQQDAALNVVQSGGYGQQTSIFTRGSNSNHTLVLEDGVRLNTGTQSSANIPYIDLSDVSRIEVLKGPASVQYGTDAIGGVVQLINAVPKKQHLFATVEAGEQSTYKTVAGADLVQDDVYFQLRGQHMESDGSAVTDAPNSPNAAYHQNGYSAKWGIDNQQYAASAEYKENRGSNAYDNFGEPASQNFMNQLIQVKGRYNVTDDVKVNVRLSQFEDELSQRHQNFLNQIDFANTKAQEADLNAQWQFTPAQNILAGATGRWTNVQSLSYGTAFDKNMATGGYYLQHQYQANGLSTQAGVRVEDNQQFGTHTVGQFGARYQLLPATSVYANVGSAFKAPSGTELYGYDANPNLKPETSFSYEIGANQEFGYNISGSLSAYRTKVKDLIDTACISTCNGDYVTTFPVYQYLNINKATLTGGEAGLKWKQDAWFSSAEYGYVDPKDDTNKVDLARRPRSTFTLTAGFDNQVYGLSASLVAKSHANNSVYDTVRIPGYVSGNVHAYWQALPYAKLFANVENVSNGKFKTAYNGSNYYLAAARMATAGVTFSY